MATTQLAAFNTATYPASGDLSASQYCFVDMASDGEVQICATTGEAALGVLTNKPTAAGYEASVQVGGQAIVKFGGTVTPGGTVMTDTSGRAIAHTGTNKVLGIYVGTANSASGEYHSVLLQGSDGTPGGGLESVSAAGAVSASTYETHLTVSGTVAYTMGDGSIVGQRKRITCISGASTPLGTVTLNGAQAAYGSEPTAYVFTTAGQYVEWEWTATGWKIVALGQAGIETVANAGTANPLCLVHQVEIADTVDFIQPDGLIAGQRSIWYATANSGTPVGTVSGLFYDEDFSADGIDVNFNAAADMADLVWVGPRWYAQALTSATIST
jgi:hypothetical protein